MIEKVITDEATSGISEVNTSQEWYEEFMCIRFILFMYSYGYTVTDD